MLLLGFGGLCVQAGSGASQQQPCPTLRRCECSVGRGPCVQVARLQGLFEAQGFELPTVEVFQSKRQNFRM